MSKNPTIEFHAYANLFPMMSPAEMELLKDDISKNGQREPIYLYDGKIIDGRNRYIACLETGTKPKFRKYEGTERELLYFVLSLNFHRRHLNTSQKACFAVNILPEIEKHTKENLSKKMSAIRTGDTEASAKLQNLNSSQMASKIGGVSERYIFDAKKLLKDSPLLFNEVLSGKISIQQAKKQLTENQDSAKLQKPEPTPTADLSKLDLKRIHDLVSELGISEQKARDYILKRKKARTAHSKENQSGSFKELKFRLPEDTKIKLQNLAKLRGQSLSETLRILLETELK